MTQQPKRRLVRRAPLKDRIIAYLDPHDLDLWLREQLETADWEAFHTAYGTSLGIALNGIVLLTRITTGPNESSDDYDVFSDNDNSNSRSSLLSWLATTSYALLVLLSLSNVIYAFRRKRNYRLFEVPVNEVPPTPSANLVAVSSSPSSSSPLRVLGSFIPGFQPRKQTPESSVWELSIWDPFPLCLTLITYFSPLHLLLYQMLLPSSFTSTLGAIFLSAILSVHFKYLISAFQRLTVDNALLQSQLLKEYNIKYVFPRLNPEVRDAGIQCQPSTIPEHRDPVSTVSTSTPTTNIKRSFRPNPNPLYDSETDLSYLVNEEGALKASSSSDWSRRSSYGGDGRRSSGGPGSYFTPGFLARPSNAGAMHQGRRDPPSQKQGLHRSIFSSPLAGPVATQYNRPPATLGAPEMIENGLTGGIDPGSSPLRAPAARLNDTSAIRQTHNDVQGQPFQFKKTNGRLVSSRATDQERYPRMRYASPVKQTHTKLGQRSSGTTTSMSANSNGSNTPGGGIGTGTAATEGGYLGVYTHANSPLKKRHAGLGGEVEVVEGSPAKSAMRGVRGSTNIAQARWERGF